MATSVVTVTETSIDNDKKRRSKQLGRIIKHLRNQLPSKYLAHYPNDQEIGQLIESSIKHINFKGENWDNIIRQALQAIIHQQLVPLSNRLSHNQIKAFATRLIQQLNSPLQIITENNDK